MNKRQSIFILLALAVSFPFVGFQGTAHGAPYYEGKTITFVVPH